MANLSRCPNLCARCSDAGWPGPGRFEGLHRASPTTGDCFVGSCFAGPQLQSGAGLRIAQEVHDSSPRRRNSPPRLLVARIRGRTRGKDARFNVRRRLASYWTKFRMTGQSRACMFLPLVFVPSFRGHRRGKDLADLDAWRRSCRMSRSLFRRTYAFGWISVFRKANGVFNGRFSVHSTLS